MVGCRHEFLLALGKSAKPDLADEVLMSGQTREIGRAFAGLQQESVAAPLFSIKIQECKLFRIEVRRISSAPIR